MRKFQRALLGFSLLLIVASWATCHFGVQHEINKIPPETRAQMSDFDWVGIQWIWGGILMFILAVMAALAALAIWVIRRRRSRTQLISSVQSP